MKYYLQDHLVNLFLPDFIYPFIPVMGKPLLYWFFLRKDDDIDYENSKVYTFMIANSILEKHRSITYYFQDFGKQYPQFNFHVMPYNETMRELENADTFLQLNHVFNYPTISINSIDDLFLVYNSIPLVDAVSRTLITDNLSRKEIHVYMNDYNTYLEDLLYARRLGAQIVVHCELFESNDALSYMKDSKVDCVIVERNGLSCYNSHSLNKAIDSQLHNLGIYIPPRDFHSIENTSVQTLRKTYKGCDGKGSLNGEIYWYTHIPNSIRDMFPVLFSYDKESGKFLEIEKIHGGTISRLFLNNQLTPQLLTSIIESLHRIHISQSDCIDATSSHELKGWFIQKFRERRALVQNNKEVLELYDDIEMNIDSCVENWCSTITVMHGDPVFTNIMLTHFGKLKFIDMRGKINKHTIYGTPWYDYAKVLQSLLGYDSILLNSTSSVNESLIAHFWNEVQRVRGGEVTLGFESLIWLTKYLIATLIPLHSETMWMKYIQLYKSVDRVTVGCISDDKFF